MGYNNLVLGQLAPTVNLYFFNGHVSSIGMSL